MTHLRYHRWATGSIFEQTGSLSDEELRRNLNTSFEGIYGTLLHLYRADSLWLARLEQSGRQRLEDYPDPETIAILREKWAAVQDGMLAFAERLGEADWETKLSYTTLAGVPYHTPIWQMVLHIVNHGTHHRGQILSMLRQLGHKPTGLDLIGYYRATA